MAPVHRLGLPAMMAIVAIIAAAPPSVSQAANTAMPPRETAVAPEVNPPGDIPDDQVFITYSSPEGFSIEVPEGWSRTEKPGRARFADKYGAVEVAVEKAAASSPTAASVESTEVPLILAAEHAAEVKKVREMRLPSGTAVAVDYLSNSETNPVTGRKIRLENRRLYFASGGRQAVVTLSAPAGADNADQWKFMAESFRWVR